MNKKSKIILRNFFILNLAVFFSVLTPQKSNSQEVYSVEKQNFSVDSPEGTKKCKEEYEKLIQLYAEYLQIEKTIFKNLSFKLARDQLLKKGVNLKFTLEDNLNQKWIFKLNGRNKSEVIYHLYKLFGLETPEVHSISFILNGKQVKGSVQRYIVSKTGLEKHPFQKLSIESLNYLLKSHVIDWLTKNLDNHVLNYLALSLDETGNIKNLARIDNDSAFTDKCDLDYDCMLCLSKQNSPYKTAKNWSYFYRLCESYKSKDINLPLEENYAFIKFVADFPEDFFEALILPVKDSSFNELLNTDFDNKKKEFENFLNPIISRKRNLLADFKKFYDGLAYHRKEKLEFYFKNSEEQKNIERISQNLVEEINKLNEEKLKLNNSHLETTNIEAVVSTEGFSILKNIYLLFWNGEKNDLSRACKKTIDKLIQLDLTAINKNEKLAIKYYIEEVRKICAGKSASFALDEINRVVENILPRK